MQEDFLHYIYKHKLWSNENLITTNGEALEIIDTGIHNKDSGPDFFNAKIKIEDTIWIGNVEIHIKSSDWYKHHHNNDLSYKNTVLHVVYQEDKEVFINNNEKIPSFEIQFSHTLYNKYSEFKNNDNSIACKEYLDILNNFKIKLYLESLAIERLESKITQIIELSNRYVGDLDEIFYVSLARSFGFGVNSIPFQLLAESLPLNIIRKNEDNIIALESLLFGQASLLEENETNDDYERHLIQEYKFFKNKYQLSPIPKGIWKTARMRPSNFPQLRIAQFAALMQKFQGLYDNIINANNLQSIKEYFKIQTSEYWHRHYNFHKITENKNTNFGTSSYNTIAINTIAPFVLYHNKKYNQYQNSDIVIDWLYSIDSEDNKHTRCWAKYGIVATNALESQALINLKINYCDLKKCLDCNFAYEIFKTITKIT